MKAKFKIGSIFIRNNTKEAIIIVSKNIKLDGGWLYTTRTIKTIVVRNYWENRLEKEFTIITDKRLGKLLYGN